MSRQRRLLCKRTLNSHNLLFYQVPKSPSTPSNSHINGLQLICHCGLPEFDTRSQLSCHFSNPHRIHHQPPHNEIPRHRHHRRPRCHGPSERSRCCSTSRKVCQVQFSSPLLSSSQYFLPSIMLLFNHLSQIFQLYKPSPTPTMRNKQFGRNTPPPTRSRSGKGYRRLAPRRP